MGRPSMPPEAKEFGQWVRRARTARGWNQRELGKRGGISHGQISRLELNGEGFLSIPLMEGIAKGLSLELGYVMSKAGWGEPVKRFSPFTGKERATLLWALTCGLAAGTERGSDEAVALVRRLADELTNTIIDHLPAEAAEEALEEVPA